MKIYKNLAKINTLKESVVSIGSFDGVHLGHQKILKSVKKHSQGKLSSLVITFFPTPQEFFLAKGFKGYLSAEPEKIDLIKKQGIQNLCILDFNSRLRKMSADIFLKNIVKAFNPKVFIVGHNHCFGEDRKGDLSFLNKNRKRYSFETIKVDELIKKEIKISSSRIRDFLSTGKIKNANTALGKFYSLNGLVISGKGLGREIGFPTANIALKENKITPANGAYFINATIDDKVFSGMCNIGFNPTVNNNKKVLVEVHLFDFNKDIYGKEINISFIEFIRKEEKFENITCLKEQLKRDKNKCLEYSLYNV